MSLRIAGDMDYGEQRYQGRLQASFGAAPPVFGAAVLCGLYHVGYGMGLQESLFLGGLGIVYALAYLTTENVLVLWPLLTPLGSWFAQLEDGELLGRLPWESLLGFTNVMAIMGAVIWFAHRRERKANSNRLAWRGRVDRCQHRWSNVAVPTQRTLVARPRRSLLVLQIPARLCMPPWWEFRRALSAARDPDRVIAHEIANRIKSRIKARGRPD